MAKLTEDYKNCTIEVDDNDRLTIQNKPIEYEYDVDTDTWSSQYLPYTRYPSLIELAHAIAGETLEFVDTQN